GRCDSTNGCPRASRPSAQTGNCPRRRRSAARQLPVLRLLPGPGDPSLWPDWRLPRHRQGEPGRISRNGSTSVSPATLRNTTLDAPNLVRDLGGNEPQFRKGWGIIGAYQPASIGAELNLRKTRVFLLFGGG